MNENEYRPQYPVSFEPIETFSTDKSRVTINIGNSGGKFVYHDGTSSFEQHFTPDGSWHIEEKPERLRQYSTLYPAVLYNFLQWQDTLSNSDSRKHVALISGSTNEVMSNFRAKLLGGAYSHKRVENDQDPSQPRFEYQIDLNSVRQDENLMDRLEKFSKRAEKMEYMTQTPMPKAGEMAKISITLGDL